MPLEINDRLALAEIRNAAVTTYNSRITEASRQTKYLNRAQRIAARAVASTDTVKSLLASDQESLNKQFGFVAGTANQHVDAVIQEVAASTTMRISNTTGLYSLFIEVQPENCQNLLSLGQAVIHASSQNLGSYDLHWLKWLLQLGDRVIVQDYYYDPTTNKGRSGGGTMISQDSDAGGEGTLTLAAWRVPPDHAGIIGDNFISRALQDKETVSRYMKLLEDIAKGN